MKKKLQLMTIAACLVVSVVFASAATLRDHVAEQQKPANPCNPCAKKKAQNPCNPCAKKAQNPCDPCAPKTASQDVYAPATSYGGWTKVNTKPFLSKAHMNVFVTTYANLTAQAAINSKSSRFPVGSILVKESSANSSGKPGAKGTIFGMEKIANGWLWVTTDPTGHVTGKGDSEQMKMCAQCHASAPMDSAFLHKK
jgi:Cytochrome P460